jgi:DNA invertase Pin-like site-specific DNA recombinase
VKEVHIACAPNLGTLKGLKDMPRLEALFNSTEYFSNMSSVAVKAGIALSKKQKGRPPLLQTDRAFVQEVADLYNKGLSIKAIAGRMNSNYNRVYRVIRSLKPEGG